MNSTITNEAEPKVKTVGVGCDAWLAMLAYQAEIREDDAKHHEYRGDDAMARAARDQAATLRCMIEESKEIRATLAEYLSLSSIDGRAERQLLRAKLKALLG